MNDSSPAIEAMRTSVIGALTGRSTVRIERGPVARFADAVTDANPVYRYVESALERGLHAIPAPPTYTFSALGYWGTFPEEQPETYDQPSAERSIVSVLEELLRRGGVALYAEEELRFVRPLFVGDRLDRVGRVARRHENVKDGTTLTFVVIENEYRDGRGELVLVSRTTLVHKL